METDFLTLSQVCCKYCITIKISITIVIQIHIQIQLQVDSVVSDTSEFINFWLRSLDMRRVTRFLKGCGNQTMLPPSPHHHAAHLMVFKISVSGDPKSSTARLSGRKLNSSFQNPQILWTISSGHDVIDTPAPFPLWWFIITYDDCRILSARA